MTATLHGPWPSSKLYPGFTPWVTKYADNGRARTDAELRAYFAEYRRRLGVTTWLRSSLEQRAKDSVRARLVRRLAHCTRRPKQLYTRAKGARLSGRGFVTPRVGDLHGRARRSAARVGERGTAAPGGVPARSASGRRSSKARGERVGVAAGATARAVAGVARATISGGPPWSDVTTGVPLASASTSTRPYDSGSIDGNSEHVEVGHDARGCRRGTRGAWRPASRRHGRGGRAA